MADGFPIPLCHFKRAGFSRLFEGNAAYGYCASKDEKYYGFKGNIMINSQGIISALTVTPANIDERESLWELTQDIKGLLLADKGLIGHAYHQALKEQTGVNLQTPSRCNMQDDRGKDANRWLTSTRRLVETVIGQLTERFHIQKVRARDLWHLTSRMARKILAHTLAVWVNVKQGNKPLQFECLGLDLN
jgi:IS5 family transposase